MDRTWLEQTYVKDGKTLQEIANIHNCNIGHVLRYMNKYGIPRRKQGPAPKIYPYITKGWLYQQFVVEGISITGIAKICDRPKEAVPFVVTVNAQRH